MFDGSCNTYITQIAHFSVRFSSGDVTPTSFYVTPLDSSCSLVLGYSWLTCYNPLIDWVLGNIDFRSGLQEMPATQDPPCRPTVEEIPNIDSPPSDLPSSAPHISLINAAAYVCACKLEGSVQFSLQLCPKDVKLRAASAIPSPPDLSSIPPKYHDFADVFSKAKATELPPH